MESLLGWISQYGYAGLFVLLVLGIVGLPVPDEALLVFSGYLISTGRFESLLAFASAFGGSVVGIAGEMTWKAPRDLASRPSGLTWSTWSVARAGRPCHD